MPTFNAASLNAKVARDYLIIVPYRDRAEHLKIFLSEVIPMFETYMASYHVIVVEQEEGKSFNSGKLINVGFAEYENCRFVMKHDIDTIPSENQVRKLYLNRAYDLHRIWAAHNAVCGGVCVFKQNTFKDVNGFPNDCWGWGIEDRAMYYRCKILQKNVSRHRYIRHMFSRGFTILPHTSNVRTYTEELKVRSDYENNIMKCGNIEKQLQHISSSGLNNLDYTIVERKMLLPRVESIVVSI